MGTRDALPGEPESVGAIWASDHFIEQLQANGTYEPASRTDAALAAALVAWRDEVREAPLSAPPSADEVVIEPRPMIQPRRIARRSVAVAGVLLAMSSAMATAMDADPLKPVRYLVDLGVSVGERISDPVNDPSAQEAPSQGVGEGSSEAEPGPMAGVPPGLRLQNDGKHSAADAKPSAAAAAHATDNTAGGLHPTQEPSAQPTAGGQENNGDTNSSAESPSAQPSQSSDSEEPPSSDPSSEPSSDDPSSEPSSDSPDTSQPPAIDGEGDNSNSTDDDNLIDPEPSVPAEDNADTDMLPDAGGAAPEVNPEGNGNTDTQGNGSNSESSGDQQSVLGDDTGSIPYGEEQFDDGYSYGDDGSDRAVEPYTDGSGSESYSNGDGDSQVDGGSYRDSEGDGSVGLSDLNGLSLNDLPGYFRHDLALHGHKHAADKGTMDKSAKAHSHREAAWKRQALTFLKHSPRSDSLMTTFFSSLGRRI
ncbi:MAG: hypothetical protein ACJ72A_13760 [Nocardioidaceae bacterium]